MKNRRKPSYLELMLLVLPTLLILYFGFWGAYQFVSPAPPKDISISAGNIHGGYYSFAQNYRDELAQEGIDLKVLESNGSRQNIERLLNNEVDVALVQGGTAFDDEDLVSLGSIYYEPILIFYRKELNPRFLTDFTDLKISVGVKGSGTHMLATQLFAINHVNSQNTKFVYLPTDIAQEKLLKGEIDVAFFVSSVRTTVMQELLNNDNLAIFDFQRADAYAQVLPFLSKITLHEGLINFKQNIPNKPITLLAPTANLVTHNELHKSLAILFLQAMKKSHGHDDLFSDPGFFPSAEQTAYPISDVAKRYLEVGPPFLIKYLPFWIATFIDRMIVMIVPFLLLLLPLFKILPPIYRWRVRSKVYRWYRELQQVDDQVVSKIISQDEFNQLIMELDRIADEVSKLHTPLSNADQIFNLLVHVDLMRKTLKSKLVTAE